MIEAIHPEVDVSRETLADLTRFHDLVQKWSPTINLVSKSSMSSLWERHIWDSAQVLKYARTGENWVDIGSGGGFPGLIVAISAKRDMPDRHVTLVESDTRKATFLRTVIRELNLNAQVITARIEACEPLGADVLSARALKDLSGLLEFADRHLSKSGTALFLKGETWETEVTAARQSWSFDLVAHKSRTNPDAAILEIKEIQRV